jgi:hypothetical protein
MRTSDKGEAPKAYVRVRPRSRPNRRYPVDASKSTVESPDERKLRALEERYRHELLGEEERCELADVVARLCCRLEDL